MSRDLTIIPHLEEVFVIYLDGQPFTYHFGTNCYGNPRKSMRNIYYSEKAAKSGINELERNGFSRDRLTIKRYVPAGEL